MLREADDARVAEVPVVRHRVAADVGAGLRDLGHHPVVRFGKLRIRDRLQRFDVVDAERLHQRRDDGRAVRLREVEHAVDAAALHNALVEQAVRGGRLHQRPDLHAAARLAEQRDVVRVAAEARDVVVDPLQRRDHIRAAGVAGVRVFFPERRKVEIAEDIQAVVQRDDHHVAVAAHIFALVGDVLNRRARGKPAAVQPDEHRLFCRRIERLRPDVEVLAVLVERPVAVRNHQLVVRLVLLEHRADIAVRERVLDALPRLHRLRLLEALCIGVFHTVKRVNAVDPEAAQLAGLRLNDRLRFCAHEISCHQVTTPSKIKCAIL